MAGSQCPLESLPDSRSLGVKLHPEPISVVVCGAYNAGKTALITRVSLTVTTFPSTCAHCLALDTFYRVTDINSIAYITL